MERLEEIMRQNRIEVEIPERGHFCDHHCAQVCGQWLCPCDYKPGPTPFPDEQRICCPWEVRYPERQPWRRWSDRRWAPEDALVSNFGLARALRPHCDPVRFTGVNHVPRYLHWDLQSFDVDYRHIIKEREVMDAARRNGTYFVKLNIGPV